MSNDPIDQNDDLNLSDETDLDLNSGKPSLKELWKNSPGLKIAVIAAVLVLSIGGYFAFGGTGEQTKSIVLADDSAGLKQTPGESELDPTYRAALEETNARAAEEAMQSGGSALPTPINAVKTSGIDVALPEKPKEDPLAEWRRLTESRRLNVTSGQDDASGDLPPEIAPIAQPIRPQIPVLQEDPELAKALSEQMRVILAAQSPASSMALGITSEPSAWAAFKAKKSAEEAAGKGGVGKEAGSPSTEGAEDPAKVIVPAGSIAYAQLLTEINSDIKGPALVHILSGPFAGARGIGKMEVSEDMSNEHIVLTFKTVVKDAVSYKIDGIAMDEKTTLTGQATDIDHHYWERVILPAAARFVEGYSSALAQTASETSVAGLGTVTTSTKPSAKDSLYEGLTEGAGAVAEVLDENADRPITVKIAKGTTMGILFLKSVTTEDANK